jgi:hypothetical protein
LTLPLNPAKEGGSDKPLSLFSFDEKDGEWKGKIIASQLTDGKSEMISIGVKEGSLRFSFRAGEERFNFEGKLPEGESTRILGTIGIGRSHTPAILERTLLTGLDKKDIARDILANSKEPGAVIKSAIDLITQAGFLKAKPEEVRSWADKAIKTSEPFGERWQRDLLLLIVEALNDQDGMAQVALPYARRAERMLVPKDRPAVHTRTLEALKSSLERAGKEDEAKEVAGKISKIDVSVRTQTYPGRPAKNNRVVVFELFTGAECPPCVAADLGYDALLKTFKPTEAIALQYHVHANGLDPVSNGDTLKRVSYYVEAFGPNFASAPQSLVSGNTGTSGGGKKSAGQDKYDQYYDAITARLDESARMKLTAKAVRKGDKIDIEADVAELETPGMSIRLRLVLVEELVDYKGGNGVEKWHHVVRAMPGGPDGVVLKEKALKHKASLDVGEVRKEITKHLDEIYKKAEEKLPEKLPLELKKLKVVALVQDDNTREILHAVQVDVEDAK